MGVLAGERGAGVAQDVIGQSRPLQVKLSQMAVEDGAPAVLLAFDMLRVAGIDLTDQALHVRRAQLESGD